MQVFKEVLVWVMIMIIWIILHMICLVHQALQDITTTINKEMVTKIKIIIKITVTKILTTIIKDHKIMVKKI